VGIERISAGQHFPTDVITAGLVGGATGFLVPWLHARSGAAGPSVTVAPVAGGGFLVLRGSW